MKQKKSSDKKVLFVVFIFLKSTNVASIFVEKK